MIELIEKIAEMQYKTEEWRFLKKRIGLVPTMGYLHEGHLNLIRLAKEKSDIVITSIFVNPTQFSPEEDYKQYPRDLQRDRREAEKVGCDIIFYPSSVEMYPPGYLSYVHVEKITKVLCGRSRPAHFRGVTTVVAKLFNIIKPHIAVFGQKDAQQTIVIQQMVKDLNFNIEVIVAPIVRESDGLAMSSRNKYLTPEQRQDALVLRDSLLHADKMVKNGVRSSEKILQEMEKIINSVATSNIDYIEIVDCKTLSKVVTIKDKVLIALAVRFSNTRLIDNIIIQRT